MIQIPSVGHLKYDSFKQNIKQDNCIEQTLEALSFYIDEYHYSLGIINLCRYLAETYEEEFIYAADDSGLPFSGKISAV